MSREVLSEVIELRLRGSAARHPGSIVAAAARLRPAGVLPLARRAGVGERRARARSSGSPTGSSSTRRSGADLPAAYADLARAVRATSPSPTSRSRARCRGGGASPSSGRGSATIEKLRVEGPRADAELVAGWLRSRLKREISLTRRDAATVTAIWVDGEPVGAGGRAAQRERAALGRARPVRPRPGVRGRRAGRPVALSATGW